MGTDIPIEGEARLNLAGFFDVRDRENVEFSSDVSMAMMLEPLAFTAAGELRVAEGDVYGRVDRYPATMQQWIPFPLETWVLLHEAEQGPALESIPGDIPLLLQRPASGPSYDAAEQWAQLWYPVSVLAQSMQPGWSQVAAGIEALGLETEHMSAEEIELAERVLTVLSEQPPFVFAAEPYVVTVDGDRFYRYEIDIDRKRFLQFLAAMINAQAEASGEGVSEADRLSPEDVEAVLAMYGATLPDEAAFATFNEVVDLHFTFRPDATLQGLHIGSTFAPPDQSIPTQIAIDFSHQFGRQDPGIDIKRPSQLHEQSLQEIIESEQAAARAQNEDMMNRLYLSSAQSVMERFYSDTGSYAGACAQLQEQVAAAGVTADLRCVSSASEYRLYTPLNAEPGTYFCIDSTGADGEVMQEPRAGLTCPR